MKIIISVLIITTIVSSCSIEKRLYTKGFFIQRNSAQLSRKETANNVERETSISQDFGQDYTLVSNNDIISEEVILVENSSQLLVQEQKFDPLKVKKPNLRQENCDILTTKKGEEIECIVKEITPTEIKYLKCNFTNSPIITIRKSDVLSIRYANGEKEVINASSSSSDPLTDQIIPPNGGKSQLVAFLLCFFLGTLGVHRFYLGHIGIGILYFLTAGLCGIGALIDIVLILTGSLKPKDGDYEKKF